MAPVPQKSVGERRRSLNLAFIDFMSLSLNRFSGSVTDNIIFRKVILVSKVKLQMKLHIQPRIHSLKIVSTGKKTDREILN